MEVQFHSPNTKIDGLAAHKIKNSLVVFNKGLFKTTDKEKITDILSSEIYRRGEIALVSDYGLVDRYLDGDDPEYFTPEILSEVSDEGLRKLGDLYLTKDRVRTSIIKAEIKGREVTDQAFDILKTHKKTTKSKALTGDDKKEAVEAAVITGSLVKAGPWYSAPGTDFKSRNIEEVYEFITK